MIGKYPLFLTLFFLHRSIMLAKSVGNEISEVMISSQWKLVEKHFPVLFDYDHPFQSLRLINIFVNLYCFVTFSAKFRSHFIFNINNWTEIKILNS